MQSHITTTPKPLHDDLHRHVTEAIAAVMSKDDLINRKRIGSQGYS